MKATGTIDQQQDIEFRNLSCLYEITRHLAEIGCAVKQGHRADNLGESDVVVVSSAIKGYNPEVEAARELHHSAEKTHLGPPPRPAPACD